MQYIHRSLITSEEDADVHLAHITFTLLQDKTINIQNITIHPVINDKIGNNMLLESKDNPYEILDKSLALDILVQDNIIDGKTFKYKL
jgi:hypothetical protein